MPRCSKRIRYFVLAAILFVLGLIACTPAFYLLALKGGTVSSDDAIAFATSWGTSTRTVILVSFALAAGFVIAAGISGHAAVRLDHNIWDADSSRRSN